MATAGVVSVLNKQVSDLQQAVLDVKVEGRTFNLANGEQLHAVGQVSFSIPEHSFTCIVGPSGCGKTTTLRMILGLDTDYQGVIHPPDRHGVAAVFQEPRLLPWRTVEQNIRLVLPAQRREESLDALFDVLELNDVRTFYPNQLSLGLARRASLARAFVLQPRLLILDEPFVSLDDTTAERLRRLLMQLWQTHKTTALMVTHNIREAALLADRILVFSKRPTRVIGEVIIDAEREQRDMVRVGDIVNQVRLLGADV